MDNISIIDFFIQKLLSAEGQKEDYGQSVPNLKVCLSIYSTARLLTLQNKVFIGEENNSKQYQFTKIDI